VALIFYAYSDPAGRLELALSGFSGRATYSLDHVLRTRPRELWPPVYSRKGVRYGAFVVALEYGEQTEVLPEQLYPEPTSVELVPLPREVFERRLGKDPSDRGNGTPGDRKKGRPKR
jgi:hypothetical protein